MVRSNEIDLTLFEQFYYNLKIVRHRNTGNIEHCSMMFSEYCQVSNTRVLYCGDQTQYFFFQTGTTLILYSFVTYLSHKK